MIWFFPSSDDYMIPRFYRSRWIAQPLYADKLFTPAPCILQGVPRGNRDENGEARWNILNAQTFYQYFITCKPRVPFDFLKITSSLIILWRPSSLEANRSERFQRTRGWSNSSYQSLKFPLWLCPPRCQVLIDKHVTLDKGKSDLGGTRPGRRTTNRPIPVAHPVHNVTRLT